MKPGRKPILTGNFFTWALAICNKHIIKTKARRVLIMCVHEWLLLWWFIQGKPYLLEGNSIAFYIGRLWLCLDKNNLHCWFLLMSNLSLRLVPCFVTYMIPIWSKNRGPMTFDPFPKVQVERNMYRTDPCANERTLFGFIGAPVPILCPCKEKFQKLTWSSFAGYRA